MDLIQLRAFLNLIQMIEMIRNSCRQLNAGEAKHFVNGLLGGASVVRFEMSLNV